MNQIEDRLAQAGVRYTRTRRQVMEALEGAPGPLTVQDLQRRLKGRVPLSSIYRSLSVLTEAGVLSTHRGPDGMGRFEPAEWISGHHHHVVCSDCGDVSDVSLDNGHERRLESISAEIAAASGFQAISHSLELVGVCSRCKP